MILPRLLAAQRSLATQEGKIMGYSALRLQLIVNDL
jgi:hypothetical protein